MLATVLRHEHHLFTLDEIDCLAKYSKMSCECAGLPHNTASSGADHARYLLVRLCLRKTDKWHRLNTLKYEGELGDNIRQAIAELCGKVVTPERDNAANAAASGQEGSTKTEPLHLSQDILPFAKVKEEPHDASIPDEPEQTATSSRPELIDHAMHADNAEQPGPVQQGAGTAPQREAIATRLEEKAHMVFAEDESSASLRDLLECLTVEELKAVAKQFKVKGSAKVCIRQEYRSCYPMT